MGNWERLNHELGFKKMIKIDIRQMSGTQQGATSLAFQLVLK